MLWGLFIGMLALTIMTNGWIGTVCATMLLGVCGSMLIRVLKD